MSDPLDRPPTDHGSDRHGYVEVIGAPPDVHPSNAMIDRLACPDCCSNLFLTFAGTAPGPLGRSLPIWRPLVAHEDTCPTYRRLQAEGRA